MANNIELIGIQSNKIDRSESQIIKRIIEAHSKPQSKEEIIENKMIDLKFSLDKDNLLKKTDFYTEYMLVYFLT